MRASAWAGAARETSIPSTSGSDTSGPTSPARSMASRVSRSPCPEITVADGRQPQVATTRVIARARSRACTAANPTAASTASAIE